MSMQRLSSALERRAKTKSLSSQTDYPRKSVWCCAVSIPRSHRSRHLFFWRIGRIAMNTVRSYPNAFSSLPANYGAEHLLDVLLELIPQGCSETATAFFVIDIRSVEPKPWHPLNKSSNGAWQNYHVPDYKDGTYLRLTHAVCYLENLIHEIGPRCGTILLGRHRVATCG